MCGIIAYFTTQKKYEIVKAIVSSLKALQNRGYDSSGIGVYNDGKISTKKILGKDLDDFYKLDTQIGNAGMGHNRWSTHGEVTEYNAHPHHSISGKLFIVHNGTINNMEDLEKIIPDYKDRKYSETDTELFINLIEFYYMRERSLEKAIQITVSQIEGPFAICVFNIDNPNEMYFCRRDLPLLIGFSDTMVVASSETLGFYAQVEHYIELKNDDVFLARNHEDKLEFNKMDRYIKIRVVKSRDLLEPYPYPYWTIKEIMEQPLTVMKSMNMGQRIESEDKVRLNGLKLKMKDIINCTQSLIFGCGTSYHAALVGEHLFKKLKCYNQSKAMLAPEFDMDVDIFDNAKNTLTLYLSQSGETKDLVDVLYKMKETDATNVSIINVVNSLIARTTGCGVYVNASRENGVASTKSFTAQVVVLALIAIWINQNKYPDSSQHKIERKKYIQSLMDLPLDIEATFTLISNIKEQVKEYKMPNNSMFILGSKVGYSIAKEGALKIKEIAYVHAEAYSLLDLKHGPFALIEPETPIIVIAHDQDSHEKAKNICSEIKTRKGTVIFISPFERIDKIDYFIQVPYNPKFSFLLCLIPLQIIAYELTLLRGHNPDFPRNLAKSVTVN